MTSTPLACCFDSGDSLGRLIRETPATVIAVRRLAQAALFPADLEAAVRTLPYDIVCAVVTPTAAKQIGVVQPVLGETLVFARTSLVARMPEAPESGAVRLCALLRAGLSPWVGRAGAVPWEGDESDAYTIKGRRLAASFEEMSEAWQRRLAEKTSDRGSGRA